MAESVRRRVLIVDDEAAIVEVLSEHFKADYDVETALNGADALGAALRHRPDVVLLDVNTPRMNGVEVLRSLPAGSPSWRLETRSCSRRRRAGCFILRSAR